MIDWIKARMKEPSTHVAIAGFLGAIGISIDAEVLGQILLGLAALFGVVGIGVKEKSDA